MQPDIIQTNPLFNVDREWLLESSEAVVWEWPDCTQDRCEWSSLPKGLHSLGLATFPPNVWGFADLLEAGSKAKFESVLRAAQSGEPLEETSFDVLLVVGRARIWLRMAGLGRIGESGCGLRALFLNITAAKDAEARAIEESEHKSEFLGRMSHDMRSPLHAIIGLSDMLRRGQVDEAHRAFVDRVEDAAESLLGLVNDLLDAEQIRTGQLKLEWSRVDLKRVVRDCVSLYEHTRRNRNVSLVCRVDPFVPDAVVSDRRRLLQVLNNLLSNAFKFTPSGEVALEVSVLSKRGPLHEIRFSVKDTGPGIDAADQPHLFKSFFRGGKNQQYRPRGQGLGLAISKDIVASFGGQIDVKSAPGQGSTFFFILPIQEWAGDVFQGDVQTDTDALIEMAQGEKELKGESRRVIEVVEQRETQPLTSEHPKILVADDSPINREIVGAFLKGQSYRLYFASDGKEAFEIYQREKPALALLDLRMPNMDGLEAARHIRIWEKESGLGRRPILALSASTLKEDVERALDAGFDAHVFKPVRRPELLRLIEMSLEND